MARSRWKLSFFSNFLWRKIVFFKKKSNFKNKRFIFYNRSSNIPHCLMNNHFRIHKGNNFRRIIVNIYNIGYKFGEFSFTRKPFHFPLKKMNKRKNMFFRK